MPMTVIVTHNAPDRTRGFLASCALEIAPGVYTAPRMTARVRERVWKVLVDWQLVDTVVVMTWADREALCGQRILALGVPRRSLIDCDGIALLKAPLTSAERAALDPASGATPVDN